MSEPHPPEDTPPPEGTPPPDEPSSEPVSWKPLVKVCILVAVVVVCLILVKVAHLEKYFQDPDWRRHLKETVGARQLAILYIVAGTPLIALGVPRIWYSFLGGALFGFLIGAAWGHMATMTGSILGFWFGHSLGREWVQRKFGKRFARLERRLHDEGFAILLLVRLCPIGNNMITNCLAGASAMRFWPFFSASVIGHLPLTVLFAMVGSGLVKGQHYQTTIGLAGFAVSMLIFVLYFRRSKLGREVAREIRGGGNGKTEE